MFSRLGRFTFQYRRLVLLAAGIFVVVAVVWGSGVFSAMGSGGYIPPSVEANRANELLAQQFGHRPGDPDAIAVYVDETGRRTVDDPEFARPVQDTLGALPPSEVISVVSYWTPGLTPEQRAELVTPDRHATYAVITLQGEDDPARLASYGEIQQVVRAGDGIATYLGGGFTSEFQLQQEASANLARSQAISLPILLVLLVLFYRGLVAAAIPVVLGLFAILGSLVMLRLLTMVTDISIFALEIAVLLGSGWPLTTGCSSSAGSARSSTAAAGTSRRR